MKKLFYIIIIIVTSYLILIFISPSFADEIRDKIGLKSLNSEIRNLKSKLDLFSIDDKGGNIVDKVAEVSSGIIRTKDIVTNKLTETKQDLDKARDAINKVNQNIQKTQESIDNTIKSAEEVKNSIKNVVQ